MAAMIDLTTFAVCNVTFLTVHGYLHVGMLCAVDHWLWWYQWFQRRGTEILKGFYYMRGVESFMSVFIRVTHELLTLDTVWSASFNFAVDFFVDTVVTGNWLAIGRDLLDGFLDCYECLVRDIVWQVAGGFISELVDLLANVANYWICIFLDIALNACATKHMQTVQWFWRLVWFFTNWTNVFLGWHFVACALYSSFLFIWFVICTIIVVCMNRYTVYDHNQSDLRT